MKRILIGPEVTDLPTLQFLVARLAHYLGDLKVDRIVISVSSDLKQQWESDLLARLRTPPGIGPSVMDRVPRIVDAIQLCDRLESIPKVAAHILVLWRADGDSEEPWRTVASGFRRDRTKFVVDWERTRSEGVAFADLALAVSRDSRAYDTANRDRFTAHTAYLVGGPKSYLIGPGLSARDTLAVDLSDGVRVMCGSGIMDDELVDHVRPQFVTLGEPVFEFGPSGYAETFQRTLCRAAEDHNFAIVTLERYRALLQARHPQLAQRVVGIRSGEPDWPQSYNLSEHFMVRTTSNILTTLMLPIAATLGREIVLFGFDGRRHDPEGWQHEGSAQLEPSLLDARLAHPGYFDFDGDDDYEQHVAALEQMVQDLELLGVTVRGASKSFMMPLRRRAVPSGELPMVDRSRMRCARLCLISITPDWTGSFGHFGPWERALSEAARASGYDYCSLASRALDDTDPSVLPVFTHGTLNREPAFVDRFEAELRAGLAAVAGKSCATACFYAADVWHLPSILQLAVERPDDTFAVNLMRSHAMLTSAAGGEVPVGLQLLEECVTIARGTGVHLCVDTEVLADVFASAIGHRPLVWPMIAVSDPRALREAGAGRQVGGPVRIVAPMHAHFVKGFAEIVALAERLSDALRSRQLSLTARFAPQPGGRVVALSHLAHRFLQAGGELSTENLSDADYAALVGGADLILLPYRIETFRTRTSGVVLDAIAAGKPVVAVRGTWIGELIEREGLGVVVDDSDVDSFHEGVRTALADLDRLTAQVLNRRDPVLVAYRPRRLLQFLERLTARPKSGPDADRVSALRRFAAIAIATKWTADVARAQARLPDLERIDDAQRSREEAYDRLAALRLVSEWRQREIDRLTSAERRLVHSEDIQRARH